MTTVAIVACGVCFGLICFGLIWLACEMARQVRVQSDHLDQMQAYIDRLTEAGNTLTYGIAATPPLAPEMPDSSGWSDSAKWEYDIANVVAAWKATVDTAVSVNRFTGEIVGADDEDSR